MVTAPSVFLAHGAPTLALEPGTFGRDVRRYFESLPAPRAIVAVSAHWQASAPLGVTSGARPGIVHDFGGFPQALYRMDYPCPGDPALAAEIVGRLRDSGIEAREDPERRLDHGVWVPLRSAFPAADVPIVQVALPRRGGAAVARRLGTALRALRERDVVVLGTGGIVHNLSRVRFEDDPGPEDTWATAFDAWVAERIEANDTDALERYVERGPNADLAAPTPEHFLPLLVALGAATPGHRPFWIHVGFQHGNLSMRSLAM